MEYIAQLPGVKFAGRKVQVADDAAGFLQFNGIEMRISGTAEGFC